MTLISIGPCTKTILVDMLRELANEIELYQFTNCLGVTNNGIDYEYDIDLIGEFKPMAEYINWQSIN